MTATAFVTSFSGLRASRRVGAFTPALPGERADGVAWRVGGVPLAAGGGGLGSLVMNAKTAPLRQRLRVVKSTQKITEAMRLVSAAKVRRAQDAVLRTRPFSEELQKVLGSLLHRMNTADYLDLPMLKQRPIAAVAHPRADRTGFGLRFGAHRQQVNTVGEAPRTIGAPVILVQAATDGAAGTGDCGHPAGRLSGRRGSTRGAAVHAFCVAAELESEHPHHVAAGAGQVCGEDYLSGEVARGGRTLTRHDLRARSVAHAARVGGGRAGSAHVGHVERQRQRQVTDAGAELVVQPCAAGADHGGAGGDCRRGGGAGGLGCRAGGHGTIAGGGRIAKTEGRRGGSLPVAIRAPPADALRPLSRVYSSGRSGQRRLPPDDATTGDTSGQDPADGAAGRRCHESGCVSLSAGGEYSRHVASERCIGECLKEHCRAGRPRPEASVDAQRSALATSSPPPPNPKRTANCNRSCSLSLDALSTIMTALEALRFLRDESLSRYTYLPQLRQWSAALDAAPLILLPGAFNPLHDGHRLLLDAARHMIGTDTSAGYELSVSNVDKGVLSAEALAERVAQFIDRPTAVTLTRAPLFTEKATVLPGRVWVIGHDTAVRLVDPKYYGNCERRLREALDTIRQHRCRFLVAGRSISTARRRTSACTLPDAPGRAAAARIRGALQRHPRRSFSMGLELHRTAPAPSA
eukprot:ctg_1005.g388